MAGILPTQGKVLLVHRVGLEEGCQGRTVTLTCPKDGYNEVVRLTCARERECRKCVQVWASQEARAVRHRLQWVRQRHNERLDARHVVVSLGSSRSFSASVAKATLSRWYRSARDALERMGVRGGVMVFHPERHCGRSWRAGPHFHALAWGRVDSDRRPSGIVVKTVSVSTRSVYDTMRYLLDHCGVIDGCHAVRYFGEASYNSAPGCPKAETLEASCAWCGGPLVRQDFLLRDGWAPLNPIGSSWVSPVQGLA